MPVDKFGRMSDAKTRDTVVLLTYINNNYIGSDGGTPVTGSIDMRGNTLNNVSDPVNPQDVATKEYTDNRPQLSPYTQVTPAFYLKLNFNFLLEETKLIIQLQGF